MFNIHTHIPFETGTIDYVFRDSERDKSLINLYNLCNSLPLSPPPPRFRVAERVVEIVLIPISYIEVYTQDIHIYGVSILQRPPQNGRSVYIRVFLFLILILYLNIFIYVYIRVIIIILN